MRGLVVVGVIGALVGACREPFAVREFDCEALAAAYVTGCGAHLGISSETANCAAVKDGQNGPFAVTIDRSAAVCEAALAVVEPLRCDELFVCLDDEQGVSALARNVRFGGTATIEGEEFLFDGETTVWIGTTKGGEAGDFEAVFSMGGLAWYLRIDDFAARASNAAFAAAIKLENSQDNLEAMGEVNVSTFALDGEFSVGVVATEPRTGESLQVFFDGRFSE